MAYIIGHSAYNGTNKQKHHKNYSGALADLLSRKVSMAQAHKKLNAAYKGSFTTCSNKRGDVIELIYVAVSAYTE